MTKLMTIYMWMLLVIIIKSIACIVSRFESRREKMKNIRGKSVKKSRDWIQEKKV